MTDIAASTDWERARRNLSPEDAAPVPGHLARAGAFAIDLAIIVSIVLIVELGVGLALQLLAAAELIPSVRSFYVAPAQEVFQWPIVVAARLVGDVLAVVYMPWFWMRGGQTPAMAFVGLRVERQDGRAIGLWTAAARMLGLAFAVVSVLGIWWVFVDDRRRGLHDLLAGTVVIPE